MGILEAKANNRSFLLFALCICIAYLLPYHVHPFRAFYNDWIVAFGVTILLAFQAEQKISNVQLPWIAALPLGLAFVILLQTLCGMLTVSWDAVFPFAYCVLAALAMAIGARMAVTSLTVAWLCDALAISHLFAGLISVGIATLQFIGAESAYGSLVIQFPHEPNSFIRPFANVAQPNQLALLLCMSIAAVWWLFQGNRIRRSIAVVTVLVLLWGLTLTQSRVGWLILPAFVLLIWFWNRRLNFKPIGKSVMIGGLGVYAFLVVKLPNIAKLIGGNAFGPEAHMGQASQSDRLVLFKQAWDIGLDHPFFGAGWYEFGPQQVKIGSGFSSVNYSQHSHNIVMNFAAEIGWPFTLLFFGIFAYWFYVGCFRKKISKEIGFAMLFLAAVAIHSMVEFPLWYAYVLLPSALLIGLIHQQQFGSISIAVSRVYIMVACLLMAAVLTISAMDYRRVVVGFRALGWENLGLKADEGTTEKPAFTMFPQFYDYFHFAKTYARKGMSEQEISSMEQIMKRFGYAPVLMRMSLVYAMNNRPDDAFKTMLTINRLHSKLYAEAYQNWESMAAVNPETYSTILKRLPKPDKEKIKNQQ